MIDYATESLEIIVADIIANAKTIPTTDIPNNLLVQECKRVKQIVEKHLWGLDGGKKLANFQTILFNRLTAICDRLYRVNNSANANTDVILNLLGGIRNILPQPVNKRTVLPLAFIDQQSQVFLERWEELKRMFNKYNIDPVLIEITFIPILSFSNKQRKLTWSDYAWLKRFFSLLENIDWENKACNSDDEAVVSQLIRMEFNHQRFFAYCYRLIRHRINEQHGKKAKLNEIIHCKTLILQDSQLADHRFDRKSETIGIQLCNWIDAENGLVAAMEIEETYKNPYKLLHRMNIFLVAFWYKMLYDLDFFNEDNLDILADKLSSNISTKRASDLSAGSISVKFHLKDERVIRELRKFVQKMLDYLDELLNQLR